MKIKKKPNLIILGPQGSGKGTQAQMLERVLKIPLFSTGVEFNRLRKEKSNLAKKIQSFYIGGALIPDKIVMKIVNSYLSGLGKKRGVIFEGFPRTMVQSIQLEKLMKNFSLYPYWVIYLNINDQIAMERLSSRKICADCQLPYKPKDQGYDSNHCVKCGGKLLVRDDDRPMAIKKRLAIYHRQTKPVLKYYRDKNQLIEIDGRAEIKEVKKQILSKLKKKAIIE